MIRVALSMLVGDGPKYAGVVFGIAITTFLTTLFLSMFARTPALVDDVPWAEIWVMDPACQAVTQTNNVPETVIDRVRGVPGVRSTARLAVGSAPARLPHGRFLTVDVIGVDDATLIGLPASVPSELATTLRAPQAVLADHAGTHNQLVIPVDEHDAWGPGAPRLSAKVRSIAAGDDILVNNNAVRVQGVVSGSPRFNPQSVLYTTYANAARILPPLRHRLTYVLASVEPGQSAVQVARRIEEATGYRARTREEFKADTVTWFVRNAEFVSHVGIMAFFAFVVGLAIAGLMLFMFTREHARIYATFKAVGASDGLISKMVIAQALFAGILGYGLGVGTCSLIGTALATTGFPFRFLSITVLIVGILAMTTATLAGLGSIRSVLRVNPALVFK